MGAKRRSILTALAFLMLMGVAVYFRLWAIHSNISSDDTQLLRQQFDIAHREAMDESAEWRLRYDQEADRNKKCLEELQVLRESCQKGEEASGVNHKLEILQKEYAVLRERLETLKRELQEERLKCSSRFQAKTGSPFLINGYPYFVYKANPKQVPLGFVLFQPNPGMVDPSTNLHLPHCLIKTRYKTSRLKQMTCMFNEEREKGKEGLENF
ncbi:Glucan endo-1,3-beta-glucosidase 11, partial [Mucuna pruriens]